MTAYNELLREVAELFSLSIGGDIGIEEFRRLEELLHENASAREYYYDLLLTAIGLNDIDVMPYLRAKEVSAGYDAALWQAVAESEREAPSVHIESTTIPATEPQPDPAAVENPKRTLSRFSIHALLFSAAAVMLFTAMLFIPTGPSYVAILTDSSDAEWIRATEIPVTGRGLARGEFALAQGFAEITFTDGAIVVIEAPAVFELESPGSMFLSSGKASAVVPEYARGFTINTFSGTIVDLGTEFGVRIEGNGSCSLHMFSGQARLITAAGNKAATRYLVDTNEARRVCGITGQVEAIRIDDKAFVRYIDSQRGFLWRGESLSLADVVGGGDGFGVPPGETGIDPASGELCSRILRQERPGTGQYVPVADVLHVDGVFSLNGQAEPMKVSSAGHEFGGFGPNGGTFYTDITTGGKDRKSVLDGVEYGVEEAYIYMRPNVGITFDLDNIKKDLPEFQCSSFIARIGCSSKSTGASVSHFWVLVDGVLRWKSGDITRDSGGVDVNVKLNNTDRFLTLATTDGGDGWEDDWCLYGNPELKLELRKGKPGAGQLITADASSRRQR